MIRVLVLHLLPAYVGPGAGFAFFGSFLSLISAVLAGIAAVLLWPFRMAWLLVRRPAGAARRKVIFLGFSRLDPATTEKMMAEGKLPNLSRLRDTGSYRRLRTTFPALSAVTWSTFATGANPAKHNVFDEAPEGFAPRKADSFWKMLGRHAIASTILRVPGSRPERFHGRELATGSDAPVSYPRYYARYLTKLLGSNSTDGEAVFLTALDQTRHGVLACVFDATDRARHTMQGHPDALEPFYGEADRITGEVLARADADTVLFVLSDYGYRAFHRAVNLNTWLVREGYLGLEPGTEYIDWTRTRAYARGHSGVYLNLRGRESKGLVTLEDAEALRTELAARLSGLRDEAAGETAIQSARKASEQYQGPYLNAAPDILIGYGEGYGPSPAAIRGEVSRNVFEDSGDGEGGGDCVEPELVPGVLFSNLRITADHPGIEDMAPTALSLFGVKAPAWMEGSPVVAA